MKKILLCLIMLAVGMGLLSGCVVSMAPPLPMLDQIPGSATL